MAKVAQIKNLMFISRSTPFLLLVAIAGCCPSLPAHRVIVQEATVRNEVLSAYSTDLFADCPWPENKWWKIFNDPLLEELIETALSLNPSMESAASRIRKAQAEVRLAQSELFPIISGMADILPQLYSRTSLFPVFPELAPFNFAQTDLTLNLSYDFDLWDKHKNTLRAERDLFFAEVFEANLITLNLSLSVAESYFTLKTTLQQERIARDIAKNRQAKQELTKLKVENNLESDIVYYQVEQDTFTSLKNYEDMKRVRELTEHALYTLLATGKPLPCIDETLFVDELFPFPLPSCLALDLLSRRPDIQAELWRIESAKHLVDVEVANYYPDINFTALVGLSTIFPEKLFESQSTVYTLGPALHLPIFSAGQIEANIDKANEDFRIAVEQYNSLIFQALQETKDALTRIERFNGEWNYSSLKLESTKKSLKLMKLLTTRLNSQIDYLDQEQVELMAQSEQVSVATNLLVALLDMIKAVGG